MKQFNEVQGLLINQSLEACRDYITKAKKEDAEKGEKYTYKIRARGSRSSAEVYDYGFDQLEKYFASTGKKTIDLSPDEVQRHMAGIRRQMAQSIPLSLGKTFTVYRYKYVKENANETPNQKTFDQLMTGHVAVDEAEIDTSVVVPIDRMYEAVETLRVRWIGKDVGQIQNITKHDPALSKITSKYRQQIGTAFSSLMDELSDYSDALLDEIDK